MTTETRQREGPERRKSVIQWLLDSEPSIRWQAMLDLAEESDEIAAGCGVSRVASPRVEAPASDCQGPDGQWGSGPFIAPIFPSWSTLDTLLLLRDLGLDPTSERAQRATGLVRDNCNFGPEFGDSPFFEGEVEALVPALAGSSACVRAT